jgi:hypothetical protein
MSNKEGKTATPSLEELMLMRELREQAEFEERQVAEREAKLAKAARLNARLLRDQRTTEKEIKNQKVCNHEKGNRSYKKSPLPEYNIYAHQLPDGTFFIKCRNACGMRWNQGDTREWLFKRDGEERIVNQTGQSFEDMWAKLPHDSLSRSDVVLSAVGSEAPAKA